MRVLIYGGGAVGLGLASCLLKAGHEAAVLAREETVRALSERGLRRTGIMGQAAFPPGVLRAISSLDALAGEGFDYVLVCVKSFDSAAAARDLAAHPTLLAPGGRIVLAQNGWGNAEAFWPHFAPERVYNARVITGFTRPEPHVVEVTVHAQPVHVGSLTSPDTAPVRELCAAIAAGDIPCRAVPDIGRDIWAKMLFNCPLNPLGAVLGVTYGALAESAHTRGIMDRVIDEAFAVMGAAGYATHWPTAPAYREVFYRTLVPRTAAHYASTLQDLRAGKRTEIDALNGAIVRLGREQGIAVPTNETLAAMVRYLERQK